MANQGSGVAMSIEQHDVIWDEAVDIVNELEVRRQQARKAKAWDMEAGLVRIIKKYKKADVSQVWHLNKEWKSLWN